MRGQSCYKVVAARCKFLLPAAKSCGTRPVPRYQRRGIKEKLENLAVSRGQQFF
jgi:hypothetical protein